MHPQNHVNPDDPETYEYIPDVPRSRVSRPAFIAISIMSMLALVSLLVYVYRLQVRVARLESRLSVDDSAIEKEVGRVRDLTALLNKTTQRNMKSIREELDKAKQDVQASFGASRAEAEQHVQRLAKQLKVEEERQRQAEAAIEQKIADAHRATASIAASTESRFSDVTNEVGSVKREVAATQSSLTKAVSDLHRVVGDLGVLSGHIATNRHELELLRALGDRNYVEFRLAKSKDPTTVNGVGLALKRTDARALTYTLELTADDIRMEKRDRSLNEPVQFYVGTRKQPYELVVNSITKNQIAGYLSVPKAGSQAERSN